MFHTVLCIGPDQDTAKLFEGLCVNFVSVWYGDEALAKVENLPKNSLILFVGGEDISPSLYASYPVSLLNCGPAAATLRDTTERMVFKKAVVLGIPVVGICRGAQMLGVLNGFPLIQHMTGHRQTHNIVPTSYSKQWGFDTTFGTFKVASDHHQAVYISNPAVYATTVLYDTQAQKDETYILKEGHELNSSDIIGIPEVFYFNHTKSLGFQYHPEWAHHSEKQVAFFKYAIDKLFLS